MIYREERKKTEKKVRESETMRDREKMKECIYFYFITYIRCL